jgi:hypothetical protein
MLSRYIGKNLCMLGVFCGKRCDGEKVLAVAVFVLLQQSGVYQIGEWK